MNTITFPHGGGLPAQAISGRDAAGNSASLRRVVGALAVVVGIAGFAVAVVAMKFALIVGQTTVPQPVAMQVTIGSALLGVLAFWCAGTLGAHPAADASRR